MNPPDRRNPDMSGFSNTLFDITSDEARDHCSNEAKCPCSRSYRGQSYRQLALAMGARGQGVQLKLKKPILDFYRAGWFFDIDVPKTSPCPELDPQVIRALEDEENPSQETVERYVEVLRRVYG